MPQTPCCCTMVFLSTPSARRATFAPSDAASITSNFYPRPPRGGRLQDAALFVPLNPISIHALREEGDRPSGWRGSGSCSISIHALREEGDDADRLVGGGQVGFLSTPSARRATGFVDLVHDLQKFLSTPSARRATQAYCDALEAIQFLSTPSARRATYIANLNALLEVISIHALREEGDQVDEARRIAEEVFLSTPSARRATSCASATIRIWDYFYPRPPRGGRPCRQLCSGERIQISIPALREEGDLWRSSI